MRFSKSDAVSRKPASRSGSRTSSPLAEEAVLAERRPAEAAQRAPPEAVGAAAQAVLLPAVAEALPGLAAAARHGPAVVGAGASPARPVEVARHA
jgi:hypothetical protein